MGGKGYKPRKDYAGRRVSGDWEDSDRGAGNKATKRAGGKVEKKSPTYLAHVKNKKKDAIPSVGTPPPVTEDGSFDSSAMKRGALSAKFGFKFGSGTGQNKYVNVGVGTGDSVSTIFSKQNTSTVGGGRRGNEVGDALGRFNQIQHGGDGGWSKQDIAKEVEKERSYGVSKSGITNSSTGNKQNIRSTGGVSKNSTTTAKKNLAKTAMQNSSVEYDDEKTIQENELAKRAKANEKARKWLQKDAKKSGYTDIALKASMSKGAGVSEATRYKKEKGYKKGGRGKPSGALGSVISDIVSKYGKGAIAGQGGSRQDKKVKGAKSSDEGKYLKRLKSKKELASKAKKAGFKSTQGYVDTMARYGGEDNYKKGKGLGT